MGILKKVFFFLLALGALVIVAGFFLPKSVYLDRSVEIAAPLCTVQAQVDGFERFNQWSPWAKIDPNTEYSFAGPAYGVGAKMSWKSDHKKVGNGSQEIVESSSGMVRAKLDFGPQGVADSFFKLEEIDAGTRIIWGFDTTFDSFIDRYFGPLIGGMLGPVYEEGLASLKEVAEALPADDWCALEVEEIEAEEVLVAYVSGTSGQDSAEVGAALHAAYGQVMGFVAQRGLEMAGAPRAINDHWNEEQGYGFDAAIPIASEPSRPLAEDSPVQITRTYAGPVVKIVHRGPYSDLEATHGKIGAYLAARGLEASDRSWEEFLSDPGSTPEEELLTHIYYPIS